MANVSKSLDRHRQDAWRIRWTRNKKRRSLFWRGTEAEAETARQHVEHLIDCDEDERPVCKATMKWLRSLDNERHQRLVKLGLTQATDGETGHSLKALIDAFIASQKSVQPGTVATYNQTRTSLETHFTPGRRIDTITKADARTFREWLATEGNAKETERSDLEDNTVRRRIGICRQIFNFAIDAEWLTRNPFKGIPATVHANPERFHYVSRQEFGRAIDACPDAYWRAIVALNRLIGVRLPSELQSLRWSDIDLPHGDLHIRSPKTKRSVKRGLRTAPILPELRPYLEDIWSLAGPGVECSMDAPVFARYTETSEAAMRTKYRRILSKAKIEPWPNLFNNGRKSAITDLLEAGHPVTDVASWVGNSPKVIWEFYAMAQERNRRRAASVITRPAADHCGPLCGPHSENVRTSQDPSEANGPGKDDVSCGVLMGSEGQETSVKEALWAILDSNQ